MFQQPRPGKDNNSAGIIKPYATTMIKSGSNKASFLCQVASLSVSGCSTSSPFSRATHLTGLARNFLPLPAGRSGWVTTATNSQSALISDFSGAKANSGVPAKMMRKDRFNLLTIQITRCSFASFAATFFCFSSFFLSIFRFKGDK